MNIQPITPHTWEPPNMDEVVEVKLRIPRRDVNKLHAWMHSDTYEQSQALRKANHEQLQESLTHCVDMALRDHGGARVMAQFMASLYNGDRVKADVSGISNLDAENFEHLMNAMRLCFETHREPHVYFVNGGEIFERIIKDWGLEKRRRS